MARVSKSRFLGLNYQLCPFNCVHMQVGARVESRASLAAKIHAEQPVESTCEVSDFSQAYDIPRLIEMVKFFFFNSTVYCGKISRSVVGGSIRDSQVVLQVRWRVICG